MTDISREAVEREFPNTKQPHGEMMRALRAALDAAEAERDYTQGTNDVLIGDNQRLQARLDAAEARERQAVEEAIREGMRIATFVPIEQVQAAFNAAVAKITGAKP